MTFRERLQTQLDNPRYKHVWPMFAYGGMTGVCSGIFLVGDLIASIYALRLTGQDPLLANIRVALLLLVILTVAQCVVTFIGFRQLKRFRSPRPDAGMRGG